MSDMVSETAGGGGKVGAPVIRTFATGATRNLDVNKLDYEGFLCPMVVESFAKYMNSHRMQKDGTLRSADNWQAGIPLDVYMKSMWRHFFDVWSIHRGHKAFSSEDGHQITMEEALNAVAFNVNGYMHELLKAESAARADLAAQDNECVGQSCWCGSQVAQDDECGDADMMTVKLPSNFGVWIGAAMILTGATYLILRVILLMQ